jgi:hypothetical protein
MYADILDLQEFYHGSEGRGIQRIVAAHIHALWPEIGGDTILALGYTLPFLNIIAANKIFAMMPAAQGISRWPESGDNRTCLVDMDHLPLPDQSINRVMVMHGLEGASWPHDTLDEIWRVLQSDGRLLLVVTNRRGLWAQSDRTPFGTGRPYSPFQIKDMLRNHGFIVERTIHTLYTPRQLLLWPVTITGMIEKYGCKFFPGFGGLIILEARKQFYDLARTKTKKTSLWWTLPMPIPASAMTYEHGQK